MNTRCLRSGASTPNPLIKWKFQSGLAVLKKSLILNVEVQLRGDTDRRKRASPEKIQGLA